MENKKKIIIEAVILLCVILSVAGIFLFAHDFGFTA